MTTAIVSAHGLTRSFGSRTALHGLNLEVQEGEIFGVLGPNGGGKTTFFRILSTLLPPDGGTAAVCGHDVAREAAAVRASIGVVFQSPSLDPHLTVGENLRYGGALYGLHGAELRRRMDHLLEALRLGEREADRVGSLSGGLARRVEVAKSLLPQPRVLLLDEPSTGLDPVARVDLWSILEQLRGLYGMTVVLTTHLMDEADRCSRVAILHEGHLRACDTPAALKSQLGGDVLSIVCASPDRLAQQVGERFGLAAAVHEGVVRIELPRAHEFVARLVEAFPGEIRAVTAGKPTLEDVFVHLTGRPLGAPFFEGNNPRKSARRKSHG